jgi:hypothetical protein
MPLTIDFTSAVTQANSTQAERDAFLRGVNRLDEHMPGWADEISLPRLDMGDPDSCILGQLFGYWSKGVNLLNLIQPTRMASYWGFDASDDISFAGLNYLWHAEVYARQYPIDTPTLGAA